MESETRVLFNSLVGSSGPLNSQNYAKQQRCIVHCVCGVGTRDCKTTAIASIKRECKLDVIEGYRNQNNAYKHPRFKGNPEAM